MRTSGVWGKMGDCDQTSESSLLQALDTLERDILEVAPMPPRPELREHVLELSHAPRPPLDPGAFDWTEVLPGVKVHVVREDPSRGLRGYLVWARPGARMPEHRHLGEETILVLQGALRDHRGTYTSGQVCGSAAGSAHSEEALPGEDCFCYVVSYNGIEFV